jgi:hypothetical protein
MFESARYTVFAALVLAACSVSAGEPDPPAAEAPVTVSPAPAALPHKGQTMQAVRRQFGEPQARHAAAGGDSPKHPPITRWDYDGFSVFFEHSHVVDAVAPDRPPQVYHPEQLQSANR